MNSTMNTRKNIDNIDNVDHIVESINDSFQDAVDKTFYRLRQTIKSYQGKGLDRELESLSLVYDIIEDVYSEHEIDSINQASTGHSLKFDWFNFSDVLIEDYDFESGGALTVIADLHTLQREGIITDLKVIGDSDTFNLNFNLVGFKDIELAYFDTRFRALQDLVVAFISAKG